MHSAKCKTNVLNIYRSDSTICVDCYAPPIYLNTVTGKDISPPPNHTFTFYMEVCLNLEVQSDCY